MIDWWNVFTHALWIAGLALALAVLSHNDWLCSRSGGGVLVGLKCTTQEPLFLLGLSVTCLGAGLGVGVWWQRVLWLLLAAGFVVSLVWVGHGRVVRGLRGGGAGGVSAAPGVEANPCGRPVGANPCGRPKVRDKC